MSIRARHLAIAAALTLAVSACGTAPGAGPGFLGKGEKAESVVLTTVDPGLVQGLVPTTYTDQRRNITAEVPVIASARQMTAAMEVLRDRGLREAAWADATEVRITYQVVAAGPGTLGIVVTPTWKTATAETTKPALVWYDAADKKVVSSPALIESAQWGAFTTAVTEAAAKDRKIDKARLAEALTSPAAPEGIGPMLGFDTKGNLIARFAPGTIANEAIGLRVSAETAKGLLSPLGHRAAAAATNPATFDGTPAPGTAESTPTASPKSTATPSADPAGTTDPTPGAPQVQRPSTAVGPDCAQVTCVALTYDDGPGAQTPELLASLKKAKAPATFFQLGQMIKANPDIAKDVASDGHEVASHSVSHPDLAKVGADRLAREVAGNADIMEAAYGRKPMLIRPPYGSHNKNVDEAVRKTGAAIIQWDLDTNDWKTRSATATAKTAVEGAKPGVIVLMHDIHASTVEAAPSMLQGLAAKDVTLVTVTELSLNSGGYQAGRAYCNGTTKAQVGFNCPG